ncbi:hypothetical protein NM688_g8728 [Phlebia brevispora]|uniref:Uncharacterized protein n=1 Tax=Phlebia brevispora TaxID=194682 RepID=A0ACC1RPU1_9APHY|nr:hypothetical protein NM688_g8728 [Phlebia brevispora]
MSTQFLACICGAAKGLESIQVVTHLAPSSVQSDITSNLSKQLHTAMQVALSRWRIHISAYPKALPHHPSSPSYTIDNAAHAVFVGGGITSSLGGIIVLEPIAGVRITAGTGIVQRRHARWCLLKPGLVNPSVFPAACLVTERNLEPATSLRVTTCATSSSARLSSAIHLAHVKMGYNAARTLNFFTACTQRLTVDTPQALSIPMKNERLPEFLAVFCARNVNDAKTVQKVAARHAGRSTCKGMLRVAQSVSSVEPYAVTQLLHLQRHAREHVRKPEEGQLRRQCVYGQPCICSRRSH